MLPLFDALTDEEKEFCRKYIAIGNAAEAYRQAFGTDGLRQARDASDKGNALLKKETVAKFIHFATKASTEELAQEQLRNEMLFGKANPQAIKQVLEHEKAESQRDAIKRWVSICNEVGAQVVVPPSIEEKKLDFAAFLGGDAFLEFPFRGEGQAAPPSRSTVELGQPQSTAKQSPEGDPIQEGEDPDLGRGLGPGKELPGRSIRLSRVGGPWD